MKYIKLIDTMAKRQKKLLHEHVVSESDRKRDKLGQEIDSLGEQINTIYNVVEELKKHGIIDPVINKEGKCYYCGTAIDIENELCIIYRSMRNRSISLFHNICWLKTQTIGMTDPIATIGRKTIDSDSVRNEK